MNLYAWKFMDGIIVYTDKEEPVADVDVIYKENGIPYEDGELRLPGYIVGGESDIIMNNIVSAYSTYNDDPYIEITGESTYNSEPFPVSLSYYRRSEHDIVIEPEKVISKVIHDGQTYIIKDAQAREDIANLIPSQTGNSGKFLTTNGTTTSWAEVQGGGNDLNKINNYTGSTIDDNYILSITSGDNKYFTPKDKIIDIFSADKWEIRFRYKYIGKHDYSAGVIACMGVADGNSTPTAKGFLITLDSYGNLCLKLSSNGTSWNICDTTAGVDTPITIGENDILDMKLIFTGTGYYLYGKNENSDEAYRLMHYVASSAKISCGSDNNSATIIYGTGVDDEDYVDHYQTFADWYLKDCYTRIWDIQYDYTTQWHNIYKPDVIETGDYDEIEIKGHSVYKTNSSSPIANEITINSCENSNEETYIELVVDDNPNTIIFTDTSGIKWVGGKPTLLAGKTYQIVIINKVGYYKEI